MKKIAVIVLLLTLVLAFGCAKGAEKKAPSVSVEAQPGTVGVAPSAGDEINSEMSDIDSLDDSTSPELDTLDEDLNINI
jgi:hypothetical protein